MTGQELREIRKMMRLTQREFADLVGVHWNSIARQERDEIGIRESQAKLIRLIAEQYSRTAEDQKRGS
jgi:transcriptional regulator with XRE-family HTH domain